MKKYVAIVLVLAMLLSLTGCVDVQSLLEYYERAQNSIGGELTGPSNASRPGGLFGPEPSTAPPTVPPTEPPTAATVAPTEPTEGEEKQQLDVTLWAPDDMVDLFYAQIDDFNRTNDLAVEIFAHIESVSQADASALIAADPWNAPDIFCFSQEYLPQLVQAGALKPLDYSTQGWLDDLFDPAAVEAATYSYETYAYPAALNNGYFMYYDKSVLSEGDIQSLEKIIAVCEAEGRTFVMNLSNGWYLPAFFFATGCVSEWQWDTDGNLTGVYDTFNSREGQLAMIGMQKLMESDCYRDAGMTYYFYNRAAVVVSGTWDYQTAYDALGDNLGMAPLPTFRVDGNSYHMSSFSGYTLMGMKPQSDSERSEILNALVQYLCDEECQLQRLELQYAPTHKAARESALMDQYPALQAMMEQATYSRSQGKIPGVWWDIVKMIPQLLQEGYCDAETILQLYEAELWEIFNPENKGWSAIGSIDGANWDKDIPLIEVEDGLFVSQWAVWFDANSEYRIRWDRSWNENYGQNGEMDGANYAPGLSGYYYIWFNAYTHESWLQTE